MRREDWKQARRAGRRSGAQGSQFMGVILIIIGALYLGSNLGWIPQMNFRDLWPLILIAVGISDLARYRSGRFPFFGVVMTTVGSVLLLRNFDLLPRDVWRYIWPSLLILWGASMLFLRSGMHRPSQWGDLGATATSANVLHEFVTFGGVRRKVQSQAFEGGSAYATFGGVELDLREAATTKEEVVIEAFAKFGGIEIRVPDAWDVTVNGTGVFGAFQDETNARPAPGSTRPRLVVTGEAIFGGVTVKN